MYGRMAEDEDDMYSGFDNYSLGVDTQDIVNDPGFKKGLESSYGRRPPPTGNPAAAGGGLGFQTQPRLGVPSSYGKPPGTASGGAGGRPMTAVRAAGFSSGDSVKGPGAQNRLKPPGMSDDVTGEETAEKKLKTLEQTVISLVEQSIELSTKGQFAAALEKAKEAGRKERVMMRMNEQQKGNDPQVHLDVTYSVLFNLANQYMNNEVYQEALNTYQVLVKNKLFGHVGRLKVNMGNIYFKLKQFSKAIKFYRMALDQVPNAYKELRVKIMQNIGIAFVKLGSYQEAVSSFEMVMTEQPTFQSGLNLVLCYFTLGDREKMKRAFQKMLQVELGIDDEDKYISHDDKQYTFVLEAIRNDSLRQWERRKKQEAERCIKLAAKVISPAIAKTFDLGYDWCIDQVKSSPYVEVANDLEIDKSLMYLKLKDFQQAVTTLKSFEKKDSKVASTAATNLSFLYLLENDFNMAGKYVEKALESDRYNSMALVNQGNCSFAMRDFEKARELYKEALQNDCSCVEALFNLGLTNKRLERYEDALDSFYKLHNILRGSAQVMYHIADVHEQMGDLGQAQEWFMQLLTLLPSDPGVLSRLGEMYDAENDRSQALQYHLDSFRYYPSNLEVLDWLGNYYVDTQFYEKAVQFFERAAVVQPTEVKWPLQVAACQRKSGNYQAALDTYKEVHRKFPENLECLQYLIRLCTDLGLKDAQEYQNRLRKAQKNKELREQRVASGRTGSGRSGTTGNDDRLSSGDAKGRRRLGAAGGGSASGEPKRHAQLLADDASGPYRMTVEQQSYDASYSDPLGPQPDRPRTAAAKKDKTAFGVDDDFGDDELGDDLLPE